MLVICSDIHGSLYSLRQAHKFAEDRDAKLIVLGDIMQFGSTLQEEKCISYIREYNISAVRGNHDDHMLAIRKELRKRRIKHVHSISEGNADFLENLPYSLECGKSIFAHNFPVQDFEKVTNTLFAKPVLESIARVGKKVAFAGHNHQPICFSLKNIVTEIDSQAFTLDPSRTYLITPGSLKEYGTVILYDENMHKVERRKV